MMGLAAERYARPGRGPPQGRRRVARRHVSPSSARSCPRSARGLIDLGLEPGDRVALLCTTRAEWTYCDFAITSAGGVVVPIYPTNSPEECEWVAGNSEARFVVCEDAEQVAKIVAVRDQLPALEAVIVDRPGGEARCDHLDELRERGRGRDAAEVAERARGRHARRTRTRSSTPPARPARRRAACSRTATTAACSTMCEEIGVIEAGDVVYLYLPLAHSYALLIQLLCRRPRRRRSPTSAATRSRSSPS